MSEKMKTDEENEDSGFYTPENYFNKLEADVQGRISLKEERSWYVRHKYALSGLAASVLLGAVLWFPRPSESIPVPLAAEQLDYASYALANAEEFEDELIFEAYSEVSAETDDNNVYSNYLLDEDIDENSLIDEL